MTLPAGHPPDPSYAAEWARKGLHTLCLVIPLGIYCLPLSWARAILTFGFLLALAGDISRARLPSFAAFLHRWVGFMLRPSELPQGRSPVLNGATYVLMAALLLVLTFPPAIVVPSLTMFYLADATAALVGRRWGQRHWQGTDRTIEGSAAFWAIATGTLWLFPSIGLARALVVAFIAMVGEAWAGRINDNLVVPFAAALVLYLTGSPSFFDSLWP